LTATDMIAPPFSQNQTIVRQSFEMAELLEVGRTLFEERGNRLDILGRSRKSRHGFVLDLERGPDAVAMRQHQGSLDLLQRSYRPARHLSCLLQGLRHDRLVGK